MYEILDPAIFVSKILGRYMPAWVVKIHFNSRLFQATEAIEAWATLVEIMFSSVRDGYYQQVQHWNLYNKSACYVYSRIGIGLA